MRPIIILLIAISLNSLGLASDQTGQNPAAVLDLTTTDGVRLVDGKWRFSDTRIVESKFRAAGTDGQPTGAEVATYDYEPKAGVVDFDDSGWEVVAPNELSARRGRGRLSFVWYRINITIPQSVAGFNPAGSTVVLETTVDDYAEIWVDGELARHPGQSGGSVIAGWNTQNRIVIGRNVRPGQKIQLALFGINGPISNPPTNYVWIRNAKLSFFKGDEGPRAIMPSEVNVEIESHDKSFERIVGPNPKAWKLAEGFQFTEGPVWTRGGLLFSDPNANAIYRYSSDGKLSIFKTPSGYAGADIAEYRQPGSNGLTLDPNGNVVVNQHGNRRIVRLDDNGAESVVADKYEGKRLNSPNDLVYRSDGALFFTDPYFGLPKFGDDPRKELGFAGVYSVINGKVSLLTKEFSGPNGIALSPDERVLYVGNWDDKRKVVFRYDVNTDGSVANGRLFFDFTAFRGEDAIDGIKVDAEGNVYVSAPGGLQVISPAGKHIGTIKIPRHIHNMAWGDDDGKTLYLCARDGLYKMRLNVKGSGLIRG